MDFKDYKSQLQYSLGVCPVIIFTLKRDQWVDRRGNIFKDRKYDKVWKQFEIDFIEGKKIVNAGSYEVIELLDRPEIDRNSSDILYAEKFAVVYGSSIRALNNLATSIIDKLQFNIYFLDEAGSLVEHQMVEGLDDNLDYDFSSTNFDDVISKYQEVDKLLLKLQREKDELEEDQKKRQQEQELFQNAINSENANNDDLSEVSSGEVNNTSEEKQLPSGDERGQNEPVNDDNNYNQSDIQEDITPEAYLSSILEDKIETLIASKPVSENIKYIDVEEQADDTVKSLFNLYRDKIWNESIRVNNDIEKTTANYRRTVREELEKLVKNELDDLLTETDIEVEGTDYERANRQLSKDYEVRKIAVEEDINNYRASKEYQLKLDLEEHIKRVVIEETEKFNSRAIPILDNEVQEYSDKLLSALREAREVGYEKIASQANEAYQNGLDEIVPKVITKQQSVLNRLVKEYTTEIDKKVGAYAIFRENQIADLRKEANDNIKLANDYKRRTDSEVEALVKAKLPQYEVVQKELDIAKKQLEETKRRSQDDKELADRYKADYQEIVQRLGNLEEERSQLQGKLRDYKENYGEENTKNRRKTIIVSGIVILTTLLGAITMTISSSNSHAKETKQLQEQIAKLETKANAKYRVGEYLPVDTGNGKVEYGKITKIKNNTVFVEVKNANGQVTSYNFKAN